ncbi:MAG TPA: hypothetical protein VM261_12570 [Kofleriaceae bacterium]|nr:hypothetical protein [Kofleriaceae bacterium]
MKKIITPGIFLLATLLTSACTETDDITTEGDDPQGEEQPTDTAECCAPDSPHGEDVMFDSFDVGRRARERFDWLRHVR